jgi:hypothetical protein
MKPITIDEILAELGKLPATDDGWYSSNDLAEAWGVPIAKAIKILGQAKKAGRLMFRRGTRESLDGRQTWVPLYKITKGKPCGKKK